MLIDYWLQEGKADRYTALLLLSETCQDAAKSGVRSSLGDR